MLVQISEKHIVNAKLVEAIERIETSKGLLVKVVISGKTYNMTGTNEQKKSVVEDIVKATDSKLDKQFLAV